MARPSASMLAGLVVVLCCSIAAQASLMAIDLGSENLKVSLIKPGRTPISIVVNEMSKRKTPALVGFANGERLLGEEAASFSVRFPDTIYMRARDLLGKHHDDPSIQTMVKEHNMPYKIVPHPTRNLAAVQVKEDVIVSAEELVGSTLQYARQIAEAQSGAPVPDAVIAVPAHFGQAQRQGILDAASLVGINVLGMINTHTAAALQFGIERDFTNKTQHVIFYDQGAGCTVVALVKYSSYLTKEGGASKAISQLEVRDIDWDEDLGANSLDTLLSMHFAKSFADKYKLKLDDVLGNARSMAKLKKQVRRTKEMLSANTAAPISIEEFHDGKDYQSSITREEFETMASSFFERAAAPLKRVLDRSGLKIEELDFVELLGGGTRVPKLQAALSDVLGGRALDRHVDADEAVVMGASMFAANLSTSFRLRKFGMADLTTYGVSLRVDEVHEQEVVPASTEAAAEGKVRNLLPYLKKLPVRRLVHFTNLTQDPLRVSLTYNTSTPHPLPPGVSQPELATFNITGINTVINRYNSSGTVNLRFEASYDGILRLTKAEAVVDYTVNETKLVPIKVPSNTTADNSTTTTAETDKDKTESSSPSSTVSDDGYDEPAPEGAATAGGEEEAGEGTKEEGETKQGEGADGKSDANQGKTDEKDGSSTNTTTTEPKVEVKYENVTVTRKKTAKVALNVSVSWTTPPLGGEALKAARAAITGWVAAEQTKRLTAAAKNELEAYIIKMRERVENDDKILKVTTSDQRTPFLAALTEAEDWLYMDGEGEAAKAFKDKLATLKKTGDAFEIRAQEAEQRPAATSAARKDAELKTAAVGLWADSRPWITEEERKEVSDKLAAFLSWLSDKEAAQAKKAIHEDGAYTAREVAAEFEKLDKAFNKIANKKKPKPPPEPPAPVNATGDGNTAGNSSETGDAPGNESKGPEDTSKESKAESNSQSNGKKEADAKAKKEAEAKAKTKKDADAAKAKREAEAKAKKEKEAKTRKEKEEKAKKGAKGGKPPPKPDAGKGNKGKTTGSKKIEADDEL